MFASVSEFNRALASAVMAGRIKPHFQPIIALPEATVVGLEVLARWNDDRHGPIGAEFFIPHAENSGLLDEITDGLIRQSFRAAQQWPQNLFITLNISPLQLRSSRLPGVIEAAARDHDFPLWRLYIEVVETAVLDNSAQTRNVINQLIAMGCKLVMDDFGTGFTSLSSLQAFPFSQIKVDRAFVGSMLENRQSRKIVTAVVGLGQSLGLQVVAEGVETEAQAELLRSIGCQLAQGFLFGRAVPAASVPILLAAPPAGTSQQRGRLSFEQRAYQITSLYQSPGTAIAFLDPDLTVVDASLGFVRASGVALDALVGRHIVDALPASSSRIEFLRPYCIAGLPLPPFEIDLPSGDRMFVAVQRVEDEIGDFLGFSVLAVDLGNSRTASTHAARTGG